MPDVFLDNITEWMLNNIFLALVPFLLSLIIFKKSNWQLNVYINILLSFLTFVFIIFLPNAPYVLTDFLHFIRQVMDYKYFNLSTESIFIFLLPQYLILITLGFSMYVLSVDNVIRFLNKLPIHKNYIKYGKILLAIIMALGVYWGRICRKNSWDFFLNQSFTYILMAFFLYIFLVYRVQRHHNEDQKDKKIMLLFIIGNFIIFIIITYILRYFFLYSLKTWLIYYKSFFYEIFIELSKGFFYTYILCMSLIIYFGYEALSLFYYSLYQKFKTSIKTNIFKD